MEIIVPGYLEAVEKERRSRTLVFLGLPENICGEKIHNLTPHLLVVLFSIGSPFVCGGGGDITAAHIAQFIWALHVDYIPRSNPGSEELRKKICDSIASRDLRKSYDEIAEYLEETFLDAPDGDAKSRPIASQPAWLIYRFRREPFRMTKEEVMHTPLRELYQLLRCEDKYNGEDPKNKLSDKVRGDWLAEMNTPEKIAERRRIEAENKAKGVK